MRPSIVIVAALAAAGALSPVSARDDALGGARPVPPADVPVRRPALTPAGGALVLDRAAR